jgi:hypothetical protein
VRVVRDYNKAQKRDERDHDRPHDPHG